MNNNSQQEKSIQKIRKPRREKKNEDIEFQKDLMQLIKLREQNHLFKQANVILERKIQNQIQQSQYFVIQMLGFIRNQQNVNNRLVLLEVLKERPEIANMIPRINSIINQRLESALTMTEESLSFFQYFLSERDSLLIQTQRMIKQQLADVFQSQDQVPESCQETK